MSRTKRSYKGREYADKDSRNRKAARSCLNHGGCAYCLRNRMHRHKKRSQFDLMVSPVSNKVRINHLAEGCS